MGSGWQEWPLVLFTVLGQCVVGGVIVAGLGWFATSDNRPVQRKIVLCMFFLWVLMGIAFIASVIHLGSPFRALNSLNRIGHSALSNEIAAGSLFFAVGGIWWLLSALNKLPAGLARLWLILTMALGLLFVLAMTRVYQIDTVPTWYSGYTTAGFFLTVVLGGPLLGAVVLRGAGFAFNGSKLAGVSVLALFVTVACTLSQGYGLSDIHSAVQQASTLVPNYVSLQIWRMALLALGLGCWLCPLIRRQTPHLISLSLGFVLVVIGELIGRGVFYGLHMTVGMAVAG